MLSGPASTWQCAGRGEGPEEVACVHGCRQVHSVEDGELGQRTLSFFADRVEGNLLAAHQELQKLALLHPAATVAQPSAATASTAS